MMRIFKALVILTGTLLLMSEQIRNYKEKRTKGTLALLILACVMFISAIIIVVGFWV
ncbi:hypothetical protein [Agathobacter sp.]